MKSFDIELAKQGKPVCLRNGKKARIICFDVKNSDYPIIALVEDGIHEAAMYFNEKGETCVHPSGYNLMMASEKKEGWVNVCNADTEFYFIEGIVYDTKEEAIKHINPDNEIYVTTVKIEWEE